jgi:hypothetical protein
VQDKVNLVSIKSRQIAKNLFPNDSEKVIDRLQYLCEIGVDFNRMAGHKNKPTPELWERVCFAVLKASEGSREKFEEVVKYVMYDIKEVFPMAGFGESLTAHRKWGDKMLNIHQA